MKIEINNSFLFDGAEYEDRIEILSHLTQNEKNQHLKEIGADEDILFKAMEAAQKVLNDHNLNLQVSSMDVDNIQQELELKCRCGSRRVADGCEPYTKCHTRCTTNSDGSQTCHKTCVSGCRPKYRYVCNPC